jgi:hypothetical protein
MLTGRAPSRTANLGEPAFSMDCRVIRQEDGAARLVPGNDDVKNRSRDALFAPELCAPRQRYPKK